MLRNALETNLNLLTKFITTCSSSSSPSQLIKHARRVFDQQPNRNDTFLCNAIIKAHIAESAESFALYKTIRRMDFEPDGYTFTALAKSCGLDGARLEGEVIHCHAVKTGLCLDLYVSTAFVDMYVKFGRIGCARKVGEMGLARSLFDEMRDRNVVSWTSMIYGYCHRGDVGAAKSLFDSMPKKNLVSWNVMIGGYCQNKQPHEAVRLFHEMQSSTSLEPDAVTIARKLFDEMPEKETASWNALINGFAVNGHGKEALEVFSEMQRGKYEPNNITFLSVLSACNHCGLVEEGRFWFKKMENFGLIPQIEHYGCMVDLLGRAGCLEETEKLIKSMPYDVNGIILSSFLFACGYYEDVTRANKILELAVKLEPWNDGNYVMLRNLYARKKRWSDADDIKSLMRKNQADKEVGCSFIEVDGRIKEFVAGDRMHTSMEAIHITLLQSWKHMMGQVPCSIAKV
ncbi:hypothetical protein ACLB2K_068980 [Fragaria x ananassa]